MILLAFLSKRKKTFSSPLFVTVMPRPYGMLHHWCVPGFADPPARKKVSRFYRFSADEKLARQLAAAVDCQNSQGRWSSNSPSPPTPRCALSIFTDGNDHSGECCRSGEKKLSSQIRRNLRKTAFQTVFSWTTELKIGRR